MVSIDNLWVSILVTLVTLIYTVWNEVYLLSLLARDWLFPLILPRHSILWVVGTFFMVGFPRTLLALLSRINPRRRHSSFQGLYLEPNLEGEPT